MNILMNHKPKDERELYSIDEIAGADLTTYKSYDCQAAYCSGSSVGRALARNANVPGSSPGMDTISLCWFHAL